MYQHILKISLLLLFLVILFGCHSEEQVDVVFQEDFEQGSLDLSRWKVTRHGDLAEAVVDVADVNPGEDSDYRLRLRANTIGTSDPLKFLGARSKNTVDFGDGIAAMFDLDWNNQSNGCYLTASFYLCPDISSNPGDEDNWLKFEYIGVPPGRNVRIDISEKVDGVVRPLHTDWGPRNDRGKPIGMPLGFNNHQIELILDRDNLKVLQDGMEIYPLSNHNLNFTDAYLYFQMSSGTNYPSREIYFDNIVVQDTSS